ncbi:YciI family protein [Psychroserpens jangbogonensis]|uniref:YciI family protein n=1 Tax=Psychroserpens jangbogonensis TaxID=1484460 RepID=UPI00053DE63A|nr:phenylalanyl-tRNA synthetase subunit alpha [Psychroserpens jangbogonensis]
MKNVIVTICLALVFLACKEDAKATTEPISDAAKEVVEIEKNQKDIDTISLVKENNSKEKVSMSQLKEELTSKGFQTFDYVDEKTQDTIIMQQYFIAFLKRGLIRNQNEEEANRLQSEHLTHLGKMYELGYADISGPFGDDGDIRGITIYNVPTQKMADSLANSDPMVKAGRLQIEIHPWWAAKGFSLR